MTLHQKVRTLRACTVTGLKIKKGALGVVVGYTEHMDPPLVWVRFPEGEAAMSQKDIEAITQK